MNSSSVHWICGYVCPFRSPLENQMIVVIRLNSIVFSSSSITTHSPLLSSSHYSSCPSISSFTLPFFRLTPSYPLFTPSFIPLHFLIHPNPISPPFCSNLNSSFMPIMLLHLTIPRFSSSKDYIIPPFIM